MYVPLEFVRGSGKGLFVYLTLIKSMTSSTYIRYNINIFTVRLHNFYISVETNCEEPRHEVRADKIMRVISFLDFHKK
jgi:hypothetical protein